MQFRVGLCCCASHSCSLIAVAHSADFDFSTVSRKPATPILGIGNRSRGSRRVRGLAIHSRYVRELSLPRMSQSIEAQELAVTATAKKLSCAANTWPSDLTAQPSITRTLPSSRQKASTSFDGSLTCRCEMPSPSF